MVWVIEQQCQKWFNYHLVWPLPHFIIIPLVRATICISWRTKPSRRCYTVSIQQLPCECTLDNCMALQAAAVANPTSRLLWFLWHGQVLLYKELLLLFLKSAHDGVPYSGWCFGMNGWLICSKAVWVHTDTEPVVDLSDWLSNMGCWQLLDWQPYPPEARLTLLWTPTQLPHPTHQLHSHGLCPLHQEYCYM